MPTCRPEGFDDGRTHGPTSRRTMRSGSGCRRRATCSASLRRRSAVERGGQDAGRSRPQEVTAGTPVRRSSTSCRGPPAASSRSPSLGGSADRVVETLRANIAAVCPDVSWLDGAGPADPRGARPRRPGHGRRRARLRRRGLPPRAGGGAGAGPAGRRGARAASPSVGAGTSARRLPSSSGAAACSSTCSASWPAGTGLGTPAATRMLARANDAGDRLVVALRARPTPGPRRPAPPSGSDRSGSPRGRGGSWCQPASVTDRAASAWW